MFQNSGLQGPGQLTQMQPLQDMKGGLQNQMAPGGYGSSLQGVISQFLGSGGAGGGQHQSMKAPGGQQMSPTHMLGGSPQQQGPAGMGQGFMGARGIFSPGSTAFGGGSTMGSFGGPGPVGIQNRNDGVKQQSPYANSGANPRYM